VIVKAHEQGIGKPVDDQTGKPDGESRRECQVLLKGKTENGKAHAQEKGGDRPPSSNMLLFSLPYSEIDLIVHLCLDLRLIAPRLRLIAAHAFSSLLWLNMLW
jgi:hypothetical protein